jgi:para-aminobenzoate synthetase/4-amino-4-deoxychorismate lyase
VVELGACRARFDDLRTGRAIACREPFALFVAHDPAEVIGVLEAAERARADGAYVAGYLSYEAAPGLDPHLAVRASLLADRPPLACFVAFEHAEAVAPVERARARSPRDLFAALASDTTVAGYEKSVEAIKDAIARGETYQCNLTVRLSAPCDGDLEELYRDLAYAQSGSYCAFIDFGDQVLLSASPELFFSWEADSITVRPMKGTAARATNAIADTEIAHNLRNSAKERAENVMIVDLLRNDLGRIAEFGSVRVRALFELERYETLWQLTSTIDARTRAEITLVEVMRALFPCGSVTGAPKDATMALIAELESSPRGPYCGTIGLLSPRHAGPRARFSVAIRTLVVDRARAEMTYGTGGAITWDSDVRNEHAELVLKSAILAERREDFALFETMRLNEDASISDLGEHLARLRSSATYFGFRYDERAISATLARVRRETSAPARVRLELARDGTLGVALGALPTPTGALVRLALDEVLLGSRDPFRHHKTTRRDELDAARARHPLADDVIVCNEREELCETTIANLALLIDHQWYTPALSAGLLAGTRRSRLIADGLLKEAVLHLDDLQRAERLAVFNSLRGWRDAVLT